MNLAYRPPGVKEIGTHRDIEERIIELIIVGVGRISPGGRRSGSRP